VHALHQVAHLDLETAMAPAQLRWRINEELPADINVLTLQPAAHRFHARHGAVARSYLYTDRAAADRLRQGVSSGGSGTPLDAAAMAGAARCFEGLHDFQSFTDQTPEEGSTRVKVGSVEVREEGALVLVRIVGSHFLWKMVRRMVGVLAEVGRGDYEADDVARLLREPSDAPARLTAPPRACSWKRVLYEGDAPVPPIRPVLWL